MSYVHGVLHRVGCSAVLLAALTGCNRVEKLPASVGAMAPAASAAASPGLDRKDLLALIFPDWQDTAAGRNVEVDLPNHDDSGRPIAGSETTSTAAVAPLEVVRLDETHAVMLTEAVETDANGSPLGSHADGAWLGAYFFSRSAAGWTLNSRIDGFDYQGFMGSVGNTSVARIAPQRFALILENGSCWQGFCGTWLTIFELGKSSVQTLVKSVPLQASNEGSSEACGSMLASKPSTEKVSYGCFDVTGKFSLALGSNELPGDLRIVFSGNSQVDSDAPLRPVQETLVYRYGQQGYKLISGRNPVPRF